MPGDIPFAQIRLFGSLRQEPGRIGLTRTELYSRRSPGEREDPQLWAPIRMARGAGNAREDRRFRSRLIIAQASSFRGRISSSAVSAIRLRTPASSTDGCLLSQMASRTRTAISSRSVPIPGDVSSGQATLPSDIIPIHQAGGHEAGQRKTAANQVRLFLASVRFSRAFSTASAVSEQSCSLSRCKIADRSI